MTADVVGPMIQILRDSDFGRFLIDEKGKWGCLDGVRTELPFGFEMTVKGPPIEIGNWSPWGPKTHITSEHAQGRFSGLVDLSSPHDYSQVERPSIKSGYSCRCFW